MTNWKDDFTADVGADMSNEETVLWSDLQDEPKEIIVTDSHTLNSLIERVKDWAETGQYEVEEAE